MGEHVLVIGAMLLDTKGKPTSGLEPGTSNPGKIRFTRGGTARNVSENLGRLGASVKLVSAIGQDLTGERLLQQTAAAGVDIERVQVIEGENTGAYIAIIENDGSLAVALDDVSVMEHVTPKFLHDHRRLFRDADMVMIDGSLTLPAMKTAVRLADQYGVPLCADPSSARLAYKLRPYLPSLHLVVPNVVEAAELCQMDYYETDDSLDLARRLSQLGVGTVILTRPDFGLDYATTDETGHIPANYSEMVDSTGTGDAVTAAVMFGMINNLSTIESIRLGAAAASLTLQTEETAVPDLSLDMLYEHLIV
ncbi:MAG: carbohydrate kinase family protein [Anaerolineae bacterium]